MPGSTAESELGSTIANELDGLMREFPEWREEYPDINFVLQERKDAYNAIPPSPISEYSNARLPDLLPRGNVKVQTFGNKTTSQAHYRKWEIQPSLTFGELPSFTGSILYPGRTYLHETTTGTTFLGVPGRRSDPFMPGAGNIKIEGEHHLDTTSRDTFVNYVGARPAVKVVHVPDIQIQRSSKFHGITQSKRDFPGFLIQPKMVKAIVPPPVTIGLAFNNLRSFETEQRKQFIGVDTRLHPMPKSMKRDNEAYQIPTEKFETLTSQMNDYRPINPIKIRKVLHPHNHEEARPDKRFDPKQPPINNYFQRRLASLKPHKCGEARLLSKKQARFLLAELRQKKQDQFRPNVLPVLESNTTIKV